MTQVEFYSPGQVGSTMTVHKGQVTTLIDNILATLNSTEKLFRTADIIVGCHFICAMSL